jgi:hypothetical protein
MSARRPSRSKASSARAKATVSDGFAGRSTGVEQPQEWCDHRPAQPSSADETGAGAPSPRGVLERVPTPAVLRKKKLTSRFRFYANLTTDATGDFLLLPGELASGCRLERAAGTLAGSLSSHLH